MLLVAVAVVIGFLVLHRSGGGGTTVAVAKGTTTTTAKANGKTPVIPPGTTTTTTAIRPAADVKVLVANASSVRGLAGLIAAKLHTAGYNTLAVVNATQQVTASIIYYQPGYQREAEGVAQTLGLAATTVKPTVSPPPVTNLSTANVLVVAGPDLAQAAPATTTTVHTATTLHPATTTTVHSTTTTTVHPATTTTVKA